MNKMQKIVCVIMVVAVLAALSVSVFAATHKCPECNGTMHLEATKWVRQYGVPCSIDPDMTDYVYKVYGQYTCRCGYVDPTMYYMYNETICSH